MKLRPALLGLALLAPGAAFACAACGCGNPVLTSMGTEPPLSGRVRFATSARAWSETEAASKLQELRFDLLASWSPSERWTVLAAVPLQLREVSAATLSRERSFGLGDVEAHGRWVFLLDDRMRPRWVLALNAGMRFPTAPVVNDRNGAALGVDAQPGSGGFVGLLGLGYSGYFGERLAVFATLQGELPLSGRAPFAGRLFAAGQYQPWAWLGIRAGAEARVEASTPLMPGGVTLFAAPELLFQLPLDVTLLAGARIPFFDERGGTKAGPMLVASLVVDL